MSSRRIVRYTRTALVVSLCCVSVVAWVAHSATLAGAADAGCRTAPLKKHFAAYGWQTFRTRFCYNRNKQRVVYGGINITEVEKNTGGKALEFRISDERKGNVSILGGRGLVIYNISTVEACTAHCAKRETLFKIRAYWDGGYQWRINESTGEVAGPP
jgi:hypothetical protein